MPSSPRPSSITGGCLCGSIRYAISFPPEAEWPPSRNATCQCTRCRKWSGAVVSQLTLIPTANIHPPFSSNPTYKTYTPPSYPIGHRIFCSNCGSSVAFVNAKAPEGTELCLGSLDEVVLCGKRGDAGPKSTKWGDWSERSGGLGRDLCETGAHVFLENSIPGVTDGMEGNKWLQDREAGDPFEGGMAELEKKIGS